MSKVIYTIIVDGERLPLELDQGISPNDLAYNEMAEMARQQRKRIVEMAYAAVAGASNAVGGFGAQPDKHDDGPKCCEAGAPTPTGPGPAPFKTGDVVKLKSGGFPMTVVECGFINSCSTDDAGYWSVSVVYAADDVPACGEGLIYEDVCADLLSQNLLSASRGIGLEPLPF